jgi:hypothetical protein
VPTRSAEAAAPAREGTGASPNCSVGPPARGPSGAARCAVVCCMLHGLCGQSAVCGVEHRARHSALRVRCAFPTTVCRRRMRLRGCLARCCTGTGLAPATSAPGLGSLLPDLHLDWARPCHIWTRTGLTPATSAPGLDSPLLHLDQDWARPCQICTGTGARPCPHLHRHWAHPSHICTGTGLTPITSGPGLGSPLPDLHRHWAHPCHICAGTGLAPAHICTGTGLAPAHICTGTGLAPADICTGTGLTPATSAPGLGSPLPDLHRDWAHPLPPGCGTVHRLDSRQRL